jgi:SAM-dependent methyltransferase
METNSVSTYQHDSKRSSSNQPLYHKVWQSIRLYGNLIRFQLTTPSARNYQQQWDNYWGDTQDTGWQGSVLWDVDPERASQIDLERFKAHIDPSLPILDLGCGNGRQSRFLAQHFDRVIGVDVSPEAVARAQRETVDQPNLTFCVLNGTDPSQAQALHDEFGDVTIYIRGVVHVIQKPDRPNFVASLRTLLGERGTLYQTELDQEALPYFRQFPGDSPSGLPKLMHRVVSYGITPIGFELDQLDQVYKPTEWQILDQGKDARMNTIEVIPGQTGAVPANYLIARPK